MKYYMYLINNNKKKSGMKEQEKREGTKNKWDQQKTDRKTADLNSSIFIIILNANEINVPSKGRDWKIYCIINKNQLLAQKIHYNYKNTKIQK